ncbi:N-acetylmuramoyl-L-alanine amidase [Paenibacillus sp. PR3]|uniref:N-acetylmuramoyl-L-alanine amidase n=1 Tax=Paenibacillus terricola TaxID=2763503 RepID=A0ABR8MUQ1_9BACL|nr:N-acetylmuramoyl-L-alanine amidase [Paenibacillus terricola]
MNTETTKTCFKDRGIKKSNFLVTRQTTMPAVLLEIGFLSNPQEEITMWNEKFQLHVAKSIAEGIEDFLQVSQ